MTVLAILFGWAFVVTLGILVLVANKRKKEAIEHEQYVIELLGQCLTSEANLRMKHIEKLQAKVANIESLEKMNENLIEANAEFFQTVEDLNKGNFELEESYQQMILSLQETIWSQVNTISYLEETKADIQETVDFHNKNCLPTL